MRKVLLDSWSDIETYMEQYLMPPGTNISQFVVFFLDATFSEGEEEIELLFNKDLLPKSYQRCPTMWAARYEAKTPYHALQGFKRGERIIIRAGNEKIKPSFINRLIEAIPHTGDHVTFALKQIPSSYKTQPYVLISKLRNKNIEAKIVNITPKQITYQRK